MNPEQLRIKWQDVPCTSSAGMITWHVELILMLHLKLVSLYKLECIRIKHKNKAMIKIGVSWCQEHFHPLVSGSRSVPTADTSSSWNCDKNRSSYCLHSTHAKYIKSRLQQSWDINVLDNRGALVTSHLHCWSQICWYYTCCQSQIEFEISDSQVYIVWLLGKDTLYKESLKGKSQIFTQCVCKWTMKIAPRVNHSFASNTRWRKKRSHAIGRCNPCSSRGKDMFKWDPLN